MKVLFLSEREVHAMLEMPACVALMRQTLATLARGDAVLPLRSMLRLPDGHGLLGLMPGYLGEPRAFGLKAVTVMPGNRGTEFDSHQGVVSSTPPPSPRSAPPPSLAPPRTRSRGPTPATWRSWARAPRRGVIWRRWPRCGRCGACACGAARESTPSASRASRGSATA